MENKKSFKKRLFGILFSMVVCMSLISVSVYAALSQSAKLTNSITITTDGQVDASVVITRCQATPPTNHQTTVIGAFDTVIAGSAIPGVEAGKSVLTKAFGTDSATETDADFTFSQATGINFYAYKIVITNSAKSDIEYNISLKGANAETAYAAPTGVKISSSVGTATLGAYADIATTDIAKSGTTTIYIVFSTTVALDQLTAANATSFDLNVLLTANKTVQP